MPIFGALTVTEARRLIKDNQRLTADNARLSASVDQLTLRVEAADHEVRRVKALPASGTGETLDSVLAELRAFVPTLPYAPGYSVLSSASDAKAFAQGLHLMLLHAQTVGRAEGAAR